MDKQPAHTFESLRDGLGGKLDELHRRATAAREMMRPTTLWKNPWVRMGLGVAIGIAIGSQLRRPRAVHHESILHGIVRAGLAAAAAMLVRQALEAERSPTVRS